MIFKYLLFSVWLDLYFTADIFQLFHEAVVSKVKLHRGN